MPIEDDFRLPLVKSEPGFSGPIKNVTAALGREAILACSVHNLSTYKVAWLRVDTQTILTIHTHVISRSRRVGVTHSDHRTWFLHIRELRESDRGWYMCQINTDPMKSQLGYLDVVDRSLYRKSETGHTNLLLRHTLPQPFNSIEGFAPEVLQSGPRELGLLAIFITIAMAASGTDGLKFSLRRRHSSKGIPPDILDRGTSTDQTVHEGASLSLTCAAAGSPHPQILWRREHSKPITVADGIQVPPVITIRNQLVGAALESDLDLECEVEAYPQPVSYWSRETGEILRLGGGLEPQKLEGTYRSVLRLPLRRVTRADYGAYRCVAKNSLGDTEGTIKLYLQRMNIVAEKSSESTPFGTQGCVKRSTLLGRGNRKRQSESECVALERMRVVYLLQASASVNNE
ncbi:hypothetical protein EVAR_14320_1 [Eumeta japonica]|uniref:Ig-like domain-containing protein n=1 Tax=Eumeta variegata TaxID=151549 RepID=A0A4C1UMF1_EUMVA|nr:hypothetical protein EVAR_14320_1 [Eumeta japonica]